MSHWTPTRQVCGNHRPAELDDAQQTAGGAEHIAMGEGRNTIALAQRGYHAVGFDVSDVGVNTARGSAAEPRPGRTGASHSCVRD